MTTVGTDSGWKSGGGAAAAEADKIPGTIGPEAWKGRSSQRGTSDANANGMPSETGCRQGSIQKMTGRGGETEGRQTGQVHSIPDRVFHEEGE